MGKSFERLYFKGVYSIHGEVYSVSNEPKVTFSVPLQGKSITVQLISAEGGLGPFKKVESRGQWRVFSEVYKVLKSRQRDKDQLPQDIQGELSIIEEALEDAAKRVLNSCKFHQNCWHLDESLCHTLGHYWSMDGNDWANTPASIQREFVAKARSYLTEPGMKSVQKDLDDGAKVLLALRHLHRARREEDARYKWIDATIAAELAIKEFLVRYRPDIKALLVQMPSPPLHKLYGTVLENYTGERSPKVNELRKGAEIRNELIHSPEAADPPRDSADQYVSDVYVAIDHLLEILLNKTCR